MSGTVILVHGLGHDSHEWYPVREHLDALGIASLAIDLPAHGTRTAIPFDWAAAVDLVATSIKDAPAGTVLVVGRAIGGHLALAGADAASVDRTVAGVVAAGIGTEVLGWVLDSYRVASATAQQFLPDGGATVDEWAGDVVMDRGSAREHGSRLLGRALEDAARFPVREALRRLDTRFTLVNGTRDRFRLQEMALRRAAQAATMVRMPGERLAEQVRDAAAFAGVVARSMP